MGAAADAGAGRMEMSAIGDWWGDSLQAEYEEKLAAADAAIAERDELLNALQCLLDALPSATTHPAIKRAKAAINRARGESDAP